MTDKYITKKIHKDKDTKAKKLGLTFNEYVDHLESLVEQEQTFEQKEQSSKLQILEGTVSSLAEALKHQRFLTDVQSKKIDDQTNMIAQLIQMQNKLLNAFGADVEFIQALKQEITQ